MSATATYQTSSEGVLRIRLAGTWKLEHRLPSAAEINRHIESASDLNQISFEGSDLQGWDSGLLTYVMQVRAAADRSGLELDCSGLPKGVQGLLQLAGHTDRLQEPPVETAKENAFLADLGNRALNLWGNFLTALEFVGETAAAFARLPVGGIRVRGSDLRRLVQVCVSQALTINSSTFTARKRNAPGSPIWYCTFSSRCMMFSSPVRNSGPWPSPR
jgi:phospholipid/cholesterol/gamma-HCH transport system permease protein